MKRHAARWFLDRPARRPLKLYASDPMAGRTLGNRARIEVSNEPLAPGPQGRRIEVVDYDGAARRVYSPVNLDDPDLLMQGGLDPTESDPRFHQQMVYAVAMRTLENFDRALGRSIDLNTRQHPRLRLFPHAFQGANAYYQRKLNAILFGYFRADAKDPGENLPGQTVFTCLSHDIITHEMTHAIVDRLKPYFLEPTNQDVLAFHEGFADIVALFQHFSFSEIVREQIQRSRTDLRERGGLVELARQFGYALGWGASLRSALDDPKARLYDSVLEPHARGSILVAAVFDAFFNVYQRRIRDLIRIATGGSGRLPEGDLHPDFVSRVASEASRAAQNTLTMCIRAFDYLPPVDVTFGDYLRALVTADFELSPDDEWGQRAAMIEAFRLRGIFPEGVTSLAEESLIWERAPSDFPKLDVETQEMLRELFFAATSFSKDDVLPGETSREAQRRFFDARAKQQQSQSFREDREGTDSDSDRVGADMARALHAYVKDPKVAKRLHLRSDLKTEIHGFHPVFRVAPGGRLLIELVVQIVQTDWRLQSELGGLPFRGGATLIASADGRVRYVITKPSPKARKGRARAGQIDRLQRQRDFVALCDTIDPHSGYYTEEQFRQRMRLRMNFASLHRGGKP